MKQLFFKKPSYGTNVEISELELATADTSFATPITVGTATTSNFVKLTYQELNNALINLGLTLM